ncbi:hypothetical protein RI129_000595 [Pyrocoelia pectoralis]|uniref:Uncharacterized protein n=1 Tax=Pyrocoelia pectoralis TaxID=417401 RepID=A0AAN7ZW41_9COLE
MLDENAYKLIFNLCNPCKPEEVSYAELVGTFDNHFAPQKSVFAERYKFYEAKKCEIESAKEWAARVRSLSVSCEFGTELQHVLRDKFICGFEKGAILNRLFEEKAECTLEEAVKIAESRMAAADPEIVCGGGGGVQQDLKNSPHVPTVSFNSVSFGFIHTLFEKY